MIGIIVQLLVSWIIIWLFEKGNLSFLGFSPTRKRIFDFALFFLITAICSASAFFLRIYFGKEQWEVNPQLSLKLVLDGTWWNIKSVLFEELIFRGVILYILIKKIGFTKAIVVSAIGFGIYHWFSFGIIGNVSQMIIIFFLTGTMGVLLAYAYSKTFSLYIPCAIHLGWNLINGFIFSQGSIGNGVFIPVKSQPGVPISYFLYFTILLLPILSAWTFNFILLKKREQIKIGSI